MGKHNYIVSNIKYMHIQHHLDWGEYMFTYFLLSDDRIKCKSANQALCERRSQLLVFLFKIKIKQLNI